MRLFHPVKEPLHLALAIIGGLVGAVTFLVLLHIFLSPRAKGRLITILTFFAGFFYFLEFLLPAKGGENFLTPWREPVGSMLMVVGAFTLPMGVVSILVAHWKNVKTRRKGWYNSVVLFGAILGMAGVAFWKEYAPSPLAQKVYSCFFDGLYIPLGMAMFSTLAFYIVSAAYRAFRVTNIDAALMMGAAVIVMLGQIPFGMWLTSWLPLQGYLSSLRIENISNWFMTVINMSVQRAIGFGLGIGGLAMALRIWFSLERGMQLGGR